MNTLETIQQDLAAFIQESYKPDNTVINTFNYTINSDESRQQFGDLSCNAALILAKILSKNPREIAQTIADNFKHSLVQNISIAGPGFLNLHFTPTAYKKLLQELKQQHEKFFKPDVINKRHYNVEFVSANPTGPLHVGHGRGGIIGDVLGNILAFVGHDVTKEFYINDAGSQIDKLGQSFKARCYHELGIAMALPEDGYQGDYLVPLAQECVKKNGKNLIDQPDTFFAQYAKEKLLAQQQETLKKFGVVFDLWFSELTLHKEHKIIQAIELLQKNGYLYENDGALWFKSTMLGDDKDRVLRKSDGQWTYVAPDLAYMLNKVERGANQLIMVLGQDHHGYVNRMQGLHTALGLEQEPLEIILYQLVSLKESGQQVRMSKRTGKIVSLEDVIDEVGPDVARFFFLNRKADAHLEFDIDLALKKTEENPVFYIQYAFVRIGSILKKAAEHKSLAHVSANEVQELGAGEQLLLKKIYALKELLASIAHTYNTHQLTYYALELAQVFHAYYGKNKVIDIENIQQSRTRLVLVKQVHGTLDLVLKLLGLQRPEHM